MKTLKETMIAFLKEEEGLTTVEYAVAGSLVAAAVVTAFTNLGTQVCTSISGIITQIGGSAVTCS